MKYENNIEFAMQLDSADPLHSYRMKFHITKKQDGNDAVSYTHLRAHETVLDLVYRLLLEKKNTAPTPRYRTKTRMQ